MTNSTLAMSYFAKAKSRLKLLPLLLADQNYSDVIRESQEIVELALKGMLRQMGIEPPKWHDVSELLISHEERFPEPIRLHLPRMAEISKWLRKERELAFYGDIDFIPSEEYTEEDAQRAIDDATFVVQNIVYLIPKYE
ncbi:MAG: HEPN domain-containing protein [Coprothermobacterota bacterium]|nr:HEPN domain-containing protein [Coprothermobacterota bacterium]